MHSNASQMNRKHHFDFSAPSSPKRKKMHFLGSISSKFSIFQTSDSGPHGRAEEGKQDSLRILWGLSLLGGWLKNHL